MKAEELIELLFLLKTFLIVWCVGIALAYSLVFFRDDKKEIIFEMRKSLSEPYFQIPIVIVVCFFVMPITIPYSVARIWKHRKKQY